MLFTIRLIFFVLFAALSVASFYIGYKQLATPMRMLFGKQKKKKSKADKALQRVYLYAASIFFGIVALIILF